MNDVERIAALQQQGFCCSQVLVMMGLEAQEKASPELVRAVQGLCGGMGSREVCGTLTGAACLLGLYAGRGGLAETKDARLGPMLQELVKWFQEEIGHRYGGILCAEILAAEPAGDPLRCPAIVVDTWQKAKEILEAKGYALDPWA